MCTEKYFAELVRAVILSVCVGTLCVSSAEAQTGNAKQLFFDGFELLKYGKAKEAVAKFEDGLKAEPNNAVARYYLGEAYFTAGQKDKAREQLRESLALEPNSPVAENARKRLGDLSGNAFAAGGAVTLPRAGTVFQDCPQCPEMVVIPAGQFIMGSPPSETDRFDDEVPPHMVTTAKPFAVGKYEVTFREWDACIADRACGQVEDQGWGRDRRPVINVSYEMAAGYTKWLSEKTRKKYRLLSEAEWEYAARGGSDKLRYWGSAPDLACQYANVHDLTSKAKNKRDLANFDCDDGYAISAPVGSFKPNAYGVYDMLGNVWEWVEDCYNKSYSEAPNDGRTWSTGDCSRRVSRGGSFNDEPRSVRFATRYPFPPASRFASLGFRVARTLP